MGLLDKIRGEFIDIIEWTEPPANGVLAYRFPRYENEIKTGAQLVVREGQAAVFVDQGRLADVFDPGIYTLTTQNLPILSTLKGWTYGFHSPFKAEVYFVSMRQWTDLKWGTQHPIIIRDTEFGPTRVRAFGTYAMHVVNPTVFLRQLIVTDPAFEVHSVLNQLRDTIAARFADVIGKSKIPVLELAGNYDRISKLALEMIAADLATLGLALTLFYVENISLPAEVEETLDTRTKMGVVGDLSQYTRFQAATAIGDAARNPGGAAGAGLGLGTGIALGQEVVRQMAAAIPANLTPVATSFYLAVGGQQLGPFDVSVLAAKAREGSLNHDTLVWRQGLTHWVPADNVVELQAILSNPPPPLP